MVKSRSETVARRLAFGLLVLAGGLFAASAGLGFGMFLPTGAPSPVTIGRPQPLNPPAQAARVDENLLHLEIGAALLSTAIRSGQVRHDDLEHGLDALHIMLDKASPTLSSDLSERLNASLSAVRSDMDADDATAAAQKAEALHLLLKTRRAIAEPSTPTI